MGFPQCCSSYLADYCSIAFLFVQEGRGSKDRFSGDWSASGIPTFNSEQTLLRAQKKEESE